MIINEKKHRKNIYFVLIFIATVFLFSGCDSDIGNVQPATNIQKTTQVQGVTIEKKKEIVVPIAYWYLGIVGSVMIFTYAVHRKDIVFMTSGFLNFLICTRSLVIHNKSKKLACPRVS